MSEESIKIVNHKPRLQVITIFIYNKDDEEIGAIEMKPEDFCNAITTGEKTPCKLDDIG